MGKKQEFKLGEGRELYCIIDFSEKLPWYVRWNPILKLLLTYFWYQRYIDVIDDKGNVRRIYEKLEEDKNTTSGGSE